MTPDGERPGSPGGSLQPTSGLRLAFLAVIAAAGGWLLHLASDWWGTPPTVSWTYPLLLLLAAAILGVTAWATWRTLHVHHATLSPHQAVNRLVLARASALVGALVGGGYVGYGLSWVGSQAELADQRIWRSGVAAVAGGLIVVASLLLERACRVRSDDRDN